MNWRHISRAFPREQKKWEMNSVPLLEVTWAGTPCLENTWSRNNFVSSRLVMVLWVGMKIACFERWSTTTRMAVKPEEDGSCSMKSMEMEFQGFSRTGNCLSNL